MSLGPVVNILAIFSNANIANILKNNKRIKRYYIKGIGCPLLILIDIVIFDQETENKKEEKMTRLERMLGQTMQILMLIAVSCLHCRDATICMNFQLTICEQQIRIILYLRSLIIPIAVCC